MQKKNRTNEEWEKLIEQQKSSGKLPKVWCAENGVNYHTYSDRKCRLNKLKVALEKAQKTNPAKAQKTKTVGTSPKFKEVQILDTNPKISKANEHSEAKPSEIAVKVGKFTIIVQPDFEEKTFLRTCEAVAKLC